MSTMLMVLCAVVVRQVFSHGAVAKPSGRKFRFEGAYNCQWCMGEMKHDGSNPPGQVRHEAKLSSPCMGTNRGDDTRPNWGPYTNIAGDFDRPTYTAGQNFEAAIAMNANHQGEAQWQFCPHSEAETDECFRRTIVKDWKKVNCYFNDCDAPAHRHNNPYTETVTLPSSLPSGHGTLRWFWVCKETNEVFASCIDVNIVGGGSPAAPSPAPAPGGAGCAADGDDCRSSSCCADKSKTCYVKDQYWASCRSDCTPGIYARDPPQYQTPWACDVLGASLKSDKNNPNPNQTPDKSDPNPNGKSDDNDQDSLISCTNRMVALSGHLFAALAALSMSVAWQ